MSGFVVLIDQEGAQVSPQMLRRMTDYMAFRGSDAQETWISGNVGMGNAMLRTTFESEFERQPFSLDGEVWITADARVDGRAELIRRLAIEGLELKNKTDSELILYAYYVWGDACVNHLIGDFAFALWDARRRRLFCARDHFGVKPFYYAQAGERLIISNTLNCVRLHPAVSDELNEQAVGDFLLVGSNGEQDTTFFADVKRLPPAHILTWSAGNLKVRRYWTLPVQSEIRYKRESDYVDRFVELLDQSVEDRLRTDHAGVFMSGGMDSTTIAATAHKIFSKRRAPFDLRAVTAVYDHMFPDQERYYSGLVAEKLNIPIQYLVADDYKLYERWDQPELMKPEPVHAPLMVISHDLHNQIAAHSRVALTGEGGDAFLRPSASYLLALIKGMKWGRLLAEVYRHLWEHRRLPRIGLRTRLRSLRKEGPPLESYPEWLNSAFESRLNLRERWARLHMESAPAHPRRPEAYQAMTDPFWPALFESCDPGVMHLPVEVRNPLFDLRLVNYSMRLPSLPCCVDKGLMRAAMRGLLPEQVRRRTKAPLAGDPIATLFHRRESQLTVHLPQASDLAEYINLSAWMESGVDDQRLWAQIRPISLQYWLKSLRSSRPVRAQHATSFAS